MSQPLPEKGPAELLRYKAAHMEQRPLQLFAQAPVCPTVDVDIESVLLALAGITGPKLLRPMCIGRG